MLGDKRFLRTIKLRNILSFGPDTPELELQSLNVLIGPNGAGKSNLIEAISLLQAAPTQTQIPDRSIGESRGGNWGSQPGIVKKQLDHPTQNPG
jgi:recombinational DNA repair ATPase RecF